MMADYLNKPILTCTVDARGRVSDVKATAPDAASRLQAELPFRLELPEAAVAADSKWERPFAIKLDPPAGTGERSTPFRAWLWKRSRRRGTTFKVSTSLKTVPKEVAELQPLLPWLWEGSVTFDPRAKRYLGAKLAVAREYPNHAGAGSKFSFSSASRKSGSIPSLLEGVGEVELSPKEPSPPPLPAKPGGESEKLRLALLKAARTGFKLEELAGVTQW